MQTEILTKAQEWLSAEFDENTRKEVQHLIDTNPQLLEESFYQPLEFGTGGMRGIMGVGINRINKYTLGMATQGLANYLKKNLNANPIKVAITHDVRNNSQSFAKMCADVLTANGIAVYLTENFRPTPELTFAVRHHNCHAGIVLTASHNPPEYNGYKVYWSDGDQIVPPHDQGIIEEVYKTTVKDVNFSGNDALITYLGKDLDKTFIDASIAQLGNDKTGRDTLKIVFTSLHGTSIAITPDAFAQAGFTQVHLVEAQKNPDPFFSTVKSPNPEEPEALSMALQLADEIQADIVIGTDPDADRLGIAVRNNEGKMILLNGNQTNVIMTDYLLKKWQHEGKITGKEFIGSTIVTSDAFIELAQKYNVNCKVGLTGFKWIGKMIHDAEGKETFICGGEESFGFMVGDFVRDKDSVTSTLLACDIAAKAKANGSSMYTYMTQAYQSINCYKEHLISITKKGLDGAAQIKEMMKNLRENPLKTIDGSTVTMINDYQNSISKNQLTGVETAIDIPKSNVLIYYTEDGTKIAARPSGTEPKIKFYFSAKTPIATAAEFDSKQIELQEKINRIIKELDL